MVLYLKDVDRIIKDSKPDFVKKRATQGVFLIAVLVALSMSGVNSQPTHGELADMTEKLSREAADLYNAYCNAVSNNLPTPSGMTQWEKWEYVANQYRATYNIPQLKALSYLHSQHHKRRVMYRTLCKYNQLRTSLLDDVCEGPVRDQCSHQSLVCEAERQSHTCNPWWRSEACLCVRLSDHGHTHIFTFDLTPEAANTCSGIEREIDPVPYRHYDIRRYMLAFLHGLKQQAEVFNDVLSPSY